MSPAECSPRSRTRTSSAWTRSPAPSRSPPPSGRYRASSGRPPTAPCSSARTPGGGGGGRAREPAGDPGSSPGYRAPGRRHAGLRPDRTPRLLHRRRLRGLRLGPRLHGRQRWALRQPSPPLRRTAAGHGLRHLPRTPGLRPPRRGTGPAPRPRRRRRRRHRGGRR